MDYGHADMNLTDPQRLAILRRLSPVIPASPRSRPRHGPAAARSARHQPGKHSPRGEPGLRAVLARRRDRRHRRRDLPRGLPRTEGDLTPGSVPLGDHPDYGRLLQELRLNRSRASWWTSQFEVHTDPLSRVTWALGLVTPPMTTCWPGVWDSSPVHCANSPRPSCTRSAAAPAESDQLG
jgi:hypothetical protein